MFRMTIRTDNDAFGDMPEFEVARILRQEADRLELGEYASECYQTIRDANGNDVGRARLKEEGE